jgi:hypothetical protein
MTDKDFLRFLLGDSPTSELKKAYDIQDTAKASNQEGLPSLRGFTV